MARTRDAATVTFGARTGGRRNGKSAPVPETWRVASYHTCPGSQSFGCAQALHVAGRGLVPRPGGRPFMGSHGLTRVGILRSVKVGRREGRPSNEKEGLGTT